MPSQAKKPKKVTSSTDVVGIVRKELLRNKGQWAHLCRVAKHTITYRWIIAFTAGRIRNPSFPRIQCVALYLGMKITIEHNPHFNKGMKWAR